MSNTDYEEMPEAIEFAEHDNTDWVNHLPEDTLRERIVKRVLVQNMKYNISAINLLEEEVGMADADFEKFATTINELKCYEITIRYEDDGRPINLRVFDDASLSKFGIATFRITSIYNELKTKLRFSIDGKYILLDSSCDRNVDWTYFYPNVLKTFYRTIKPTKLSQSVIKRFRKKWKSIVEVLSVDALSLWGLKKVSLYYYNNTYETFGLVLTFSVDGQDIDVNVVLLKKIDEKDIKHLFESEKNGNNTPVSANIGLKSEYVLTIGHDWDYCANICKPKYETELLLAVKELVNKYIKRNYGYIPRTFELAEDISKRIGKMTPELCDEIFDADYDIRRIFHVGLSYETDIYEAELNNIYQDIDKCIYGEGNDWNKRWNIERTFLIAKAEFEGPGYAVKTPAYVMQVSGIVFDGIICITIDDYYSFNIFKYTRSLVFQGKYKCNTTECNLASMLDIIINGGYTGGDYKEKRNSRLLEYINNIEYNF